jgi:antitoxin component YwqK of YwqJK toxin-antitoxin module
MYGKPPRFRFGLRSMLVLVAICGVAFGVWINWEYIPGTFYFDANGLPQGTGTTTYDYDSGQLMLKERYFGGLIYRATWYRPDGTEIATEEFNRKTGGIGYYLRQDGSIKSKCTYTYSPSDHMYVANGDVTFYNADGSIERTVRYEDGREVGH